MQTQLINLNYQPLINVNVIDPNPLIIYVYYHKSLEYKRSKHLTPSRIVLDPAGHGPLDRKTKASALKEDL